MNPTQDQWSAYQNIFDYFNDELFDGQLPSVILNFSRKSKTHGFFAPLRWEGAEGSSHEISLNPETMIRDPKEYLSTLVHEMVHLWQQEFGKPSRRNYHNKEWAEKMKLVGLIPSNTGAVGGKEVGQSMAHYIEPNGKYEIAFTAMSENFLLPFSAIEWAVATNVDAVDGQDPSATVSKKGKNKNQYKSKYTCTSCLINVWGKAELNIKCGDCDVTLIILDDGNK